MRRHAIICIFPSLAGRLDRHAPIRNCGTFLVTPILLRLQWQLLLLVLRSFSPPLSPDLVHYSTMLQMPEPLTVGWKSMRFDVHVDSISTA